MRKNLISTFKNRLPTRRVQVFFYRKYCDIMYEQFTNKGETLKNSMHIETNNNFGHIQRLAP